MQFIVPTVHRVAGMNRCHKDAGHQGQHWTLYLLQDQFCWPGVAKQIQRVISGCERCTKHKGACAKALLQPILVTSPMELLHVHFISIEMMMDLDQPPHIVNVLVLCDHFTRHIMAYMTTDQTARTVAKFLWQGYILIFRAAAKLLSDWGSNFESNIISKLCDLMGIQKEGTSPYHPQTNGQVEWTHQMLVQRIGKLSKDWKADWPKHLPELVNAYNSMTLAVTEYIPQYLMFGKQLCLPIDFYFPSSWAQKNTGMSITLLLTYVSDHMKPSRRCKCSPPLRLKGRGDTMIVKLIPFHWSQVTWSWPKSMATKGGERWETSGRRNHTKWNAKVLGVSLPTPWKTSRLDAHESSTGIDFFSLLP